MTFTANDLVWYEQDGEMHSAGYSIDSLFKKMGVKPMTTLNVADDSVMTGGSPQFSDLFRAMGVPVGLSMMLGDEIPSGTSTTAHDAGIVPDSLYDKLLGLISPDQPEPSTTQSGGRKKKNTRKQRRPVANAVQGRKRVTRRRK
jgi:hypothetical protein